MTKFADVDRAGAIGIPLAHDLADFHISCFQQRAQPRPRLLRRAVLVGLTIGRLIRIRVTRRRLEALRHHLKARRALLATPAALERRLCNVLELLQHTRHLLHIH